MKKIAVIFLFLTVFYGYGICKEPIYKVGDTVNPINVNTLLDKVSKLNTVKDEYETQTAYEQRMLNYQSQLQSSYVVTAPLDKDKVKYDAENKTLNVNYDAVGYRNLRRFAVLMKIVAITKPEGFYKASNAYGASIDVKKIHEDSVYIFDKREDHPDSYQLPGSGFFQPSIDIPAIFKSNGTPYLVSFQNLEPSLAKEIKNNLQATIVFSLKPPFYVKDKGFNPAPTFQNPIDIDEDEVNVYADINSILLLDGNKVIAVIVTR